MNSNGSISTRHLTSWITMALLGAALAASGLLLGGGPAAKATGFQNAMITSYLKIGDIEGESQQTKARGLVVARQTGRTSRNGTRPMSIIAVLVGLKAGGKYKLALSANRCKSAPRYLFDGAAPLITITAKTDNVLVRRNFSLKRKVLRRAKSVVLLSRQTGKRVQACGRVHVAAGDINGDGIAG